MSRRLAVSSAARDRVERATAWLDERDRHEELLVVGATLEAAADLTRLVARRRGAAFGWRRATLGQVAATLASKTLAARGLSAAGGLPLEALCARVVDSLRREGALGRFQPVALFPGLPRALATTLAEIRLAGVEPAAPELVAIHRAYEAELGVHGLADRALVFRLAAEAVRGGVASAGVTAALVGRPLLLLDLAVASPLERDLCAALASLSPNVLATAPEGDARSIAHLERALEVTAERLARSDSPSSLRRLQAYLFSDEPAPRAALGRDVVVLSAPGESRECVEIARLVQQKAAAGVAFDRMAILLRAPAQYRAHLEEALRRAAIPAHFARGTREPDPAGRAFVSLLACAAEGLSARGFAEYLSLGQVPDATAEGAPPPPRPPAERWVPPDEELISPRALRSAEALAVGDDEALATDPEAPTRGGTLRAPRRWERLLIDSAVIGGADRWAPRLDALAQRLALDLAALEEGDAVGDRVRRKLADLDALRRFALPLLVALAQLPDSASWGGWALALSALATQSLRRPDRVLAVLAELWPMADVGPVDLAEVRLVLGRRLTDLVVLPEHRPAGRIFVAPIDSARGLSFEVVFVPGLAERLFPQKVAEDPILRDADRVPLGLDTNDDRIARERLALRLAVGAASSQLVLSYPRVDMDQSRPRVPSFYGLEVIRAAEGELPGFAELARRAEKVGLSRIGWPAPREPELAIDEAEYDLALLERLFQREERDTVGTARYLLGANRHLARALRFRARRWTLKKWTPVDGLVDPQGLARVALDRHTFAARSYSPTALQHFASCPYRFFLEVVHRLAPREVPEAVEELGPRERGSLVHETLYELLGGLRDDGLLPITELTIEPARRRLDEVLDRVARRFHDDLAPAIERVWDDGIAAVRADLREWLRRAALDVGWAPARFELSFGLAGSERRARDPGSRDEPVMVAGGIQLRGSIDLVERGPQGALRATDYKTGRVHGKPGATVIGGGEVLQPVFYALALEQLFPNEPIDEGRLYYCTSTGGFEEVPIPLDDAARSSASQVTDVIGRALTEGFLPAAPKAGACEYCDYKPVCGPYEEIRMAKKSPDKLAGLRRLRTLP